LPPFFKIILDSKLSNVFGVTLKQMTV